MLQKRANQKSIAPTPLLKPGEVLTSTQMLARLERTGVSPGNARQILLRRTANGEFWRSEHLALTKNGRLFAARDFVGTERFLEIATALLDSERPGLARCVNALRRSRVLLKVQAAMLLASPDEMADRPKYPGLTEEFAALSELGAARLEDTGGALERLTIPKIANTEESSRLAREAAGKIQIQGHIAEILMNQFRRQNLVGWNSQIATSAAGIVILNNFPFTAAAFSWLAPMLRVGQKKQVNPTPMVLDVHARECNQDDVEGLIERMARAGQNTQTRLSFFGAVAANHFSEEAWKCAKDAKLMAINLKDAFGEAALDNMVIVERLINAVHAERSQVDPSIPSKLATSLEELRTNPYVKDLRSIGFEAFVALVLRSTGWENVRLNVKVPHTTEGQQTSRELDVSGWRNDEYLRLIECKAEGRRVPLDAAYVRKFFTETVPAYIRQHGSNRLRQCDAEIWTTGRVDDDARSALAEIKLKGIVCAKLVDHEGIRKEIPGTLGSCERLLEAIAAR